MRGSAFPRSLWADTAPAGPDLPVFAGEARADVVVIGAGFTGLSAALHLAEAGTDVVVLEAVDVGFGASGRNNGQVIPTLTRPDPDDLVARFGGEAGERFVALLRDSAEGLFRLIDRHGIDCEAEQTGWLQPAHSPGRIRISERRYAQWSRRGAPVELLDRDAVSRMLGTDAYFGGLLNRSGGHINPLALVRGLARRVLALGGRIFARSPAISVRRTGSAWRVATPGGTLTAGALIAATNAYSDGAFDTLRRSLVPVASWQMATAPLGEAARASIIPGRQAVSDTHGDLRFFRYDARGRLVTGGALILPFNGPERLKRIVGTRLKGIFPQIGEVSFDHVWNGWIGMTPDYTPRLHELGPDGYAWLGCNGRGVALSVALGRELARLLTGVDRRELALPFTPVTPIPLHGLARLAAPWMLALYRWRDAREMRG